MASKYEKASGYRANTTGIILNEMEYARRRRREVEARDHIVAIGYAERQVAETLRRAGKVNTRL